MTKGCSNTTLRAQLRAKTRKKTAMEFYAQLIDFSMKMSKFVKRIKILRKLTHNLSLKVLFSQFLVFLKFLHNFDVVETSKVILSYPSVIANLSIM